MTERPHLPIVLVEFFYCTHDSGWKSEDSNLRGCARCKVVGWRIQADKSCIVLAMMRSGEGHCSERLIIPKGAIIHTTELSGKE